jgi:fructoselysine-6-P-deglycase FrlB-like protein
VAFSVETSYFCLGLVSALVRWEGTFVGKPFDLEMSQLNETYAWAMSRDISSLVEFANAGKGRGLFAVGSGGSLSVATHAAYLHQLQGSQASAVTPFELHTSPPLRKSALLLYSARGNNSDIVSACRSGISREPSAMGILSFDPAGKLARLARSYDSIQVWAESGPWRADGFLATNSLLASFVLTNRLYKSSGLPGTYAELIELTQTDGSMEAIVRKEHLVVLYDPSTKAAAVDLESKMSEAGLASVQFTDFRNFAHGRHHWIARNRKSTGVVAFVSPESADVGNRTLAELVGICDTVTIRAKVSIGLASLACIPRTFEMTRLFGRFRKMDPGRPGVPLFGRRIYNLKARSSIWVLGAAPAVSYVVSRKIDELDITCCSEIKNWEDAARNYISRLRRQEYRAIVFDFDNTLCGPNERFGSLRPDVVSELSRLARLGMRFGVATGRGKSVREQLQASIPRKYWGHFRIGYYNGSEIGNLEDDKKPELKTPETWLEALAHALKQDSVLRRLCVTVREKQITVETREGVSTEWLWREVLRVSATSLSPVRVTHSTRSVDIVPLGVTKLTLLEDLGVHGIHRDFVLCIGDLGQFPGNDFELLTHPYSISCDQASSGLEGCWNIAPMGYRGVQATLYYLGKLLKTKNGVRFCLPDPR